MRKKGGRRGLGKVIKRRVSAGYGKALAMVQRLHRETTRLHKQLHSPEFTGKKAEVEERIGQVEKALGAKPLLSGNNPEVKAWESLKTALDILKTRLDEMEQAKAKIEGKIGHRRQAARRISKLTKK